MDAVFVSWQVISSCPASPHQRGLLLLLLSLPAHADITGKARVVDGDTIWISETKIRLHGIDAPEMKQTCRTSKGNQQDRYKRLLAVCYVGPFNINEQMVTDGWALAYRKYSTDYVRAETFAKARREGLWRGEFVPPWEWRRK